MMVSCEGPCQDWYHCSCINVDEDDASADANDLLDRFICPKCTTDKLFTTWKPMCRYNNVDKSHRRAARANDNSKYCSKECGSKTIAYYLFLLRKDDDPSMGGALNLKEVAMLLSSVKNASDFHALGSKPRLLLNKVLDGKFLDDPGEFAVLNHGWHVLY